MSGKKSPLYYWDACVYLSWLNKGSPRESQNAPNLPDIQEIITLNEDRKLRLVTSQITMIEILTAIDQPDAEKQFQDVFNGEWHTRWDVDGRVILKAREIRSNFRNEPSQLIIRVPDAIHLATAVILGADELHTFDNGKIDRKGCSLLALSGHRHLSGLLIKRPEAPQTDLPNFEVPEIPSEQVELL